MLLPSRWSRYVWAELLPATLLGLSLWTFLLLMNTFFLVAERALAKNLGWDLTLRMFALEIPKVLVMTIPIGILTGCLIAVGRLSADNEWTAVQGAGHGVGRLLRPVGAFGGLAAVLAFGFYGYVVPKANYAARSLRSELIIASNLAADLSPGAFYTQLEGIVLFVENIRPSETGRLEGVLIHRDNGPGGFDEMLVAASGDIYPLPADVGGIRIELHDGVQYGYRPDEPSRHQFSTFNRLPIDPPAPALLQRLRDAPVRTDADRTPGELLAQLRAAREDPSLHPIIRGNRVRSSTMELHQRFVFPLAAFIFAVLAVPLGMTQARSGKGAGFALSFIVILIYWVVFAMSKDQATRGVIPPVLGVWSANLLIGLWATLSCVSMARRQGERRGLLSALFHGLRRLASLLRFERRQDGLTEEEKPIELAGLGGTSRRLVGRLDAYVSLLFLRMFAIALGGGYTIYVIVELRRLLDGIAKSGEPLARLGEFFVFALPGMFGLVLPVASLIAAVVVVAALHRTGEMTAMKASGISAQRSVASVLLLTLLACGGLFFSQEYITPTTNARAGVIRDRILNRAPVSHGMPTGGKWAFGPGGQHLYHYRWYDERRDVFQGMSVFSLDRSGKLPRMVRHRFGAEARWTPDGWELSGGWERRYGRDRAVQFEEFEGERLVAGLDSPDTFTRREAALDATGSGLKEEFKSADMRRQIAELEDSGYDTTRLQVAYWGKFSQALTPLVMVIIGLPFAFRVGRRGSLYGIGVALLLVLAYWATFALFNAMGLENLLEPLLAAWAPNVFFAFGGLYLLLFVPT